MGRNYLGVMFVSVFSGAAFGQVGDNAAYQRLMGAKTLRCTIGPGAVAEWKSSQPAISGKARLIGHAGAEDVVVWASRTGLTFVERTAGGNVNLTTVFARQIEGDFVYVHSRHVLLLGEPLPSQYHGTCKRLD
jgi:hypothetical protein